MALKSAQVTVGTTAVEVTGTDVLAGDGSTLLIKGSADMFVGGPDVTAANGFLVSAGEAMSYDLSREQPEKVFAVVATGSATAYVLRGRV